MLRFMTAIVFAFSSVAAAQAERFMLLTGADALHYPGVDRFLMPSPGPGFPGTLHDGDRLAGTADVGGTVAYVGTGAPLFAPNQFGSLSMLFRRGTVPAGGANKVPLLGIEFLGGPQLDLDGDLTNGMRSFVPVTGQTPVAIPDSFSRMDLAIDTAAGTIRLSEFDAMGTNEGGPNIGPLIATIVVNIAGTGPQGQKSGAINPAVDTRLGSLTPFAGTSGTLTGVYRVSNLGFELWEDTCDPNSATAANLGTLQFLGSFRGWVVERNPQTNQFPTLAGQGLGSTLWPTVNSAEVGDTFNAATPTGALATISGGATGDSYAAAGNGGLALAGGDLGAYFDTVVAPNTPAGSERFVYLESAGWGVNNSSDPIFGDTIGYDAVIIAAQAPCNAYVRCDANGDGVVNNFDIDPFILALLFPEQYPAAYSAADLVCSNDASGDGAFNNFDIDPFVACLVGE